jgi:hypothetical protein
MLRSVRSMLPGELVLPMSTMGQGLELAYVNKLIVI